MCPDQRTVGVEEELLLFDRVSGASAPVAELLVDASEHPTLPSGEHELKRQQIEIATSAAVRMADLRTELVGLRREVGQRAAQLDAAPAAVATDPAVNRPARTPDPRYDRMMERFGSVAAGQLTCGMHVHVSVTSRAEGVGVLDRIRPWLPVLRAMSANSPFSQGGDTGYQSYRSITWALWPTAGPAEIFGTPAAYDRTVRELIASGAALDEGMIYFDARLSAAYPTVEIRVMDVVPQPDDAILLAALCRSLVDTAAFEWRHGEHPPAGPASSLLRAASWRAGRFGLTDTLLDPVTGRLAPAEDVVAGLVDHTWDAVLANGDEVLVRDGIERLCRDGTGAARQRAAFAARHDVLDVVDAAIRWTLAESA